jgi:hypothetical protein
MNWVRPPHAFFGRVLLAMALAGAAVAVPVFDTVARPKKHVEEEAPPPPPPPAAAVGLPSRLVADATAYQAYIQYVTTLSPDFSTGLGVSQALKASAAYQPEAFIRGAVAYAAVAALEDAGFVRELRAAGNSPENRRLMVGYIMADPAYVFLFKGSDRAAGLAKEALGTPALRLYAQGEVITKAAYAVQHQSWSKEEVIDRTGRLAAVKAAAATPFATPPSDKMSTIQQAASGVAPLTISAPPAKPPYTPLVARALQVAAIAALGEATDEAYERMVAVTQESHTDTCLNMAKLNLYQCLAVAKPNYEDIFCIGQHVMQDTGACMARNTGAILPLELSPQPLAIPSPIKAKAKATAKRKHPHA